MPGLPQINGQPNQFGNGSAASAFHSLSCSNGSVSANGFWSKHRDDVSYNHLQKFWMELSPQARQKLLRIDKQTLFEQARKNMYCSRCNGLLLEGFLQIVMYGKSLQQEGAGHLPCNRLAASKNRNDFDLCTTNGCQDDIQDPSVHPWGGLTTTRDGILTLLDCYLYSKSLKVLQNVFDSARARERERELLYPDACGGGGRGWISQGMAGYGRGHGTRETCALHTARLSVDTLVDFWSALGEETRQSLLRMKEEDFIERLMYRFDSKRFCRDCRRNVIREFKELKELKRMRREPRCTNWFCVADTAFQYEVSHDTVQADWHQTFVDTYGTYHHFEWAVGTGEGKADILEFENVGLSARVQVNGLDLSSLNACYITLRAWKMDGRCTELSVKAHALKGQQCVHCRLVVGDGFVTITRGESIRRFFEHAEEAEEEEDDDSMDKDGNELEGECSRPQKHAKSPELAREFLLDAATVIFKEQVEKAFREGTARQNAHSIFVCLALKLLEERVHVACKEIITLEKQMKLLEEEEKEKRQEEERKERRRTKEREKKLRRKERLREKEKDREKKCSESNQSPVVPDVAEDESSLSVDKEPNANDNGDAASETIEAVPSGSLSPDIQDEQDLNEYNYANMQNNSDDCPDGDFASVTDGNGSYVNDYPKYSRRKLKYRKEFQMDQSLKWSDRQRHPVVSENGGTISKSEFRYYGDSYEISTWNNNGLNKPRTSVAKSGIRNSGSKFGEKFHCPNNRTGERYDLNACCCKQQNDYRVKAESHSLMIRTGRENKSVSKSEPASDMAKSYYRGNKYNQVEYMRESSGRPKSRIITSNNFPSRDSHTKQVWEPTESHKKYPRSNSDSDVTLSLSSCKGEVTDPSKFVESSGIMCSDDVNVDLVENGHVSCNLEGLRNSSVEMVTNSQNESNLEEKDLKDAVDEEVDLCSLTPSSSNGTTDPSNSDNCSSCLSEGDCNTSSSNIQNPDSSSTSDSEDLSQQSEGRDNSPCKKNGFPDCSEVGMEKKQNATPGEDLGSRQMLNCALTNASEHLLPNFGQILENGKTSICMGSQPQGVLPPLHNQNVHYPMFQAPAMGYYQQSPVTWPATPANGLIPFPHPSPYIFAGPLGYTLNGNSRVMQYGALQQLTPPMFNPGQVPVLQPIAHTNGVKAKEPSKISNPNGVKEVLHEPNMQRIVPTGGAKEAHREPNKQRVIPTGQKPLEAPPNTEVGQKLNSDKSHMENAGFSLFHFGGPVDLSTGYKVNPVPSKAGTTGDVSPKILSDNCEVDHACIKKDAIEEYNLFAASNGIRFSFF